MRVVLPDPKDPTIAVNEFLGMTQEIPFKITC